MALQAAPSTYCVGGAPSIASAAGELAGAVLHRVRLSPPFGDLELTFLVDASAAAPGTGAARVGGRDARGRAVRRLLLMYRFAVGQMRLARQQQDFVSAVSHELKTPLTSIRMYGEMLKAGWADEASGKRTTTTFTARASGCRA